jgi:7,8-dihydro-6-hydroxymethylpterin-pyrophosphokinase
LRRFCLLPLQELNGEWMHPVLNKNVNEMLAECLDECDIEIWKDN